MILASQMFRLSIYRLGYQWAQRRRDHKRKVGVVTARKQKMP
jgi:hypothetical protein